MATVTAPSNVALSLLQQIICSLSVSLYCSFERARLLATSFRSLTSSSTISSVLFRYISSVASNSLFLEVMSCFYILCCHWVSGPLVCFTQKSELLTESGVLPSRLHFVTKYLQSHKLGLGFPSQSRKTLTQSRNLSLYYSASMYCVCK